MEITIKPRTAAITMRNSTAIVGWTDSLLHRIPRGVVDHIRTTTKYVIDTLVFIGTQKNDDSKLVNMIHKDFNIR